MRFAEPLCLVLRCSPAIGAVLERDLPAAIIEAGGTPNAFVLAIARPPEVRVEPGATRVAVHLVGPGGIAHRGQIEWTCEAHPGESIAADDSGTAQRRCVLRARWVTLPREAIQSASSVTREPAGTLPFVVERAALGGPDVVMEVEFAREPEPAELDELGERLEDWRGDWNRAGTRGLIHSIGLFERLGPRRFEISIDFGSAGQAALEELLGSISREHDDLPIARVALRDYSVR